MAGNRRHDDLVPPREGEALGLNEGLSWMKGKSFRKCMFETDSQILAQACKGSHDNSYFDTIDMDCIDLFKHFDDVLIVFS